MAASIPLPVIGDAFSAATSAQYGISNKTQITCSLRLDDDRNDVVFGPCKWSASNTLEHRLWLKQNGIDLDLIDRAEFILKSRRYSRENAETLSIANSQLINVSLKMYNDQSMWLAEKITRAAKDLNMPFLLDNPLTVAIAMWEYLREPIVKNGIFHKEWSRNKKQQYQAMVNLVSAYPSWRAEIDDNWKTNRLGCHVRYAIITDRLSL